ncbi:MAG: hypothetical protein HDR80_02970 [Bacteroides sp.]|nr:hypothetical protein [Bacteroides sp.]
MNYKSSLFALLFAGMSLSAAAQTHAEGQEYYEAGQYDNAKELLLRNHNNAATDKGISYYYQGLIALQEGKASEAAAFFNKGAEANPDYPYNYIGLGQISLASGDAKVAENNFKQAEGLDKKDAGIQIAIARAYDAVDPAKYEKEITKYLDKARKKDIKSPEIYLFEGDRLARAKEYGNAGAKYEMALSYDPNATAAYFKYANLFAQVNPQYGINMLKKLLQLNPNSALGQRSLANAYYDQNDYSNAVAEYGKYVKNPNHFKQDEDRYALLLFSNGDYQAGYDFATDLLAQNPDNFTARRFQFMNACQIKSLEDKLLPMAEELYARHQANPDKNRFAQIDYTLIADEMVKAKKAEEAVAVLKDGIATLPNATNLYKQLAMTYVDANDMAGACDAYAGYLEHSANPGYNDMIQGAVFAFYAGVQYKEDPAKSAEYYALAGQYADKAAELYPAMYRPLKIKGDIEMQKDSKSAAAIDYYIKAIEKLESFDGDTSRFASDAKNMYNAVGNSYLDKKDAATAKRYFNGYLKYDPDNADYRKFVEGL